MNNKKGEGDLTLSKLVEYTIGAIILLLILLPFISYFIKTIFFPPPSDLEKEANAIINEISDLNANIKQGEVSETTIPIIFLKQDFDLEIMYLTKDLPGAITKDYLVVMHPKCKLKEETLCLCLTIQDGTQVCKNTELLGENNNKLADLETNGIKLSAGDHTKPIRLNPGKIIKLTMTSDKLTITST